MATSLYLKTSSFRGIGPTETNSSNVSPVLDSYRPAGLSSFLEMSEHSSTYGEVVFGGTLQFYPGYSTFVNIGTWVTPINNQTVTISDNFEIVLNMWEQADMLYASKDRYPTNWITYSLNLKPYVNIYTFDNELGKRDTIKQGYIDPEATFTSGYVTRTIAPEDAYLFSAGDKLVMELWAYHDDPTAYGFWWESMSLGPDSKLNFPALDMDFGSYSSAKVKNRYNIRGNAGPVDLLLKYDFAMCKAGLDTRYYLFGTDFLDWYYETESPGRGRASMMVRSRCESGFDDELDYYKTDYKSKWVMESPSIHECFCIDDFEYFTDSTGFGGKWSVSDETHSFKITTEWDIAQNVHDYNLLTFYAKSNNPTMIWYRFWDSLGNTSTDLPFFITDRWERYEASLSWGLVDTYTFKGVQIESSNSGHVAVDDIFLLKYAKDTENYDWCKLMMTEMNLSKTLRYSSFKLPFRQDELIQFHGENNAEGSITLFSVDMEQAEFMSELMRFKKPVFLRYKNRGIPIVLRDINRKIRSMATSSIQHTMEIPFFEVYDFNMY